MLSNLDIHELTEFRHALHRHPEVSGQEEWTASQIAAALAGLSPDRLRTGIGGHGVVAEWIGPEDGPSVMFRAELDALPIFETGQPPYRSEIDGKGHLCGHDGHMSILMGLGRTISRNPPQKGRVVLLFQPAEEDGSGARAVIDDPQFDSIKTDWAFALHNMPGLPMGQAAVISGPACCASEGLRISFGGRTSHASAPEKGISPALAMSELIPTALQAGTVGETVAGFKLVSVCHARIGDPAFGITPGQGELWLTLRTMVDDDMQELRQRIVDQAEAIAQRHGLTVDFSRHDQFAACVNDPEATELVKAALADAGIRHEETGLPMRASEDFGLFGHHAKATIFLLGAGSDRPMLHNPDYDFPDELIGQGVSVFNGIYRQLLG